MSDHLRLSDAVFHDVPALDVYEEAIAALLKLTHLPEVTEAQSVQITDQVSALRNIRRRNQFLPLKDTSMTVDEAIAHFSSGGE